MRWRFAEKLHWSLEEIDNMSLEDMREYLSIQDADSKTEKWREM